MGLGGLKGGWVVAPKQDNDAFSGPNSMQLKDNELSGPHSVDTEGQGDSLWSSFNMQLKDNELHLILIQLH